MWLRAKFEVKSAASVFKGRGAARGASFQTPTRAALEMPPSRRGAPVTAAAQPHFVFGYALLKAGASCVRGVAFQCGEPQPANDQSK